MNEEPPAIGSKISHCADKFITGTGEKELNTLFYTTDECVSSNLDPQPGPDSQSARSLL